MPPMPPWKHGENIFAGPKLAWVDPYSPAHLKAMMAEKKDQDPAAGRALQQDRRQRRRRLDWRLDAQRRRLGRQAGRHDPQERRLPATSSSTTSPSATAASTRRAARRRATSYKDWIATFANGMGNRRAAVMLEPDALGLLKKCLSEEDQKERLGLLRFAVHAFAAQRNTAVYIDAGTPAGSTRPTWPSA